MPAHINFSAQLGLPTCIWPLLLEKAYAKHYQSYANLARCDKTDLIADLLGSPPSKILLGSKKEEGLVDSGFRMLEEGGVLMGRNDEKGLWCGLSLVENTYTTDDKILAYRDNSRPYEEVINTTSRKPDSVSRVNITPLEAVSLRTIFWIPADNATNL